MLGPGKRESAKHTESEQRVLFCDTFDVSTSQSKNSCPLITCSANNALSNFLCRAPLERKQGCRHIQLAATATHAGSALFIGGAIHSQINVAWIPRNGIKTSAVTIFDTLPCFFAATEWGRLFSDDSVIKEWLWRHLRLYRQ